MYHFPDQETIEKALSLDPVLNTPFYQQKHFTDTIIKLASSRLSNQKKTAMQIVREVIIIVEDMKYGVDSFTKDKLDNERDVTDNLWIKLIVDIEEALLQLGVLKFEASY